MTMQALVRTIAEALVDDPAAVEVREIEGDHKSLVELKVAQPDIGKIIGKEGKTAQAIRTVLMAASAKSGRRTHLDIVE